MELVEKIAVLFKKYVRHPDKAKDLDSYLFDKVCANWNSMAILPVLNDNTRLWIGYDVGWWRVMVSCRDKRFVTAEIKKETTSTMPDGDIIVYEMEGTECILVESSKAENVIAVIKRSVETSYEQFSQ